MRPVVTVGFQTQILDDLETNEKNLEDLVHRDLLQSRVTIFTADNENEQFAKPSKLKEILHQQNIRFCEIHVNKSHKSDEIKLGLSMLTGFNHLPSIFFGHEHIGGIADLQGLITEEKLPETMLRNGIERQHHGSLLKTGSLLADPFKKGFYNRHINYDSFGGLKEKVNMQMNKMQQ